jgi:hypothetical protein
LAVRVSETVTTTQATTRCPSFLCS